MYTILVLSSIDSSFFKSLQTISRGLQMTPKSHHISANVYFSLGPVGKGRYVQNTKMFVIQEIQECVVQSSLFTEWDLSHEHYPSWLAFNIHHVYQKISMAQI